MTVSVAVRREELAVDPADPFFFDHPLDHIPGMLMVHGLLELVRNAHTDCFGAESAGRVRANLSFEKFCESDRPAVLSCALQSTEGSSRWNVAVKQGGGRPCTGVVELINTQSGARGDAVRPPRPRSRPYAAAPAALVHRRRPENILVSRTTRAAADADEKVEARILTPPEGHFLCRLRPGFQTPLEFIEAGRQFGTMLEHEERGRPADAQFVLLGLELDVPARVGRTVPLGLSWSVVPNRGNRSRYTMELLDADTGAGHGTLVYESHALRPDSYARMRSA